MSDPFNRDGRLSASMLRQIGAESAGGRRHTASGRENSWTALPGALFVPSPVTLQQFVKVTSTGLNVAQLEGSRSVTDGVVNGTTTLTSATANFTSADVGKEIAVATGGVVQAIPPGTTIASFTNNTTVIMSQPTPTSASGCTLIIDAIFAFSANLETWSSATGNWSDSTVVWWVSSNNELPIVGTRYESILLGTDKNGQQIWCGREPALSGSVFITANVNIPGAFGTISPATGPVLSMTCVTPGAYLFTGMASAQGQYTVAAASNVAAGITFAKNGTALSTNTAWFLGAQSTTLFLDSTAITAMISLAWGDKVTMQGGMFQGNTTNWTTNQFLATSGSGTGMTWQRVSV